MPRYVIVYHLLQLLELKLFMVIRVYLQLHLFKVQNHEEVFVVIQSSLQSWLNLYIRSLVAVGFKTS